MVTSARSASALTAAAQYPVRLCHNITTRGRDEPVTPAIPCRRRATDIPKLVASRRQAGTRELWKRSRPWVCTGSRYDGALVGLCSPRARVTPSAALDRACSGMLHVHNARIRAVPH